MGFDMDTEKQKKYRAGLKYRKMQRDALNVLHLYRFKFMNYRFSFVKAHAISLN